MNNETKEPETSAEAANPLEPFVMPEIVFATCRWCHGYGVRDNGDNCVSCGGKGRGGLNGSGTIGSGELMFDKATGRRITHEEFAKMLKKRKA